MIVNELSLRNFIRSILVEAEAKTEFQKAGILFDDEKLDSWAKRRLESLVKAGNKEAARKGVVGQITSKGTQEKVDLATLALKIDRYIKGAELYKNQPDNELRSNATEYLSLEMRKIKKKNTKTSDPKMGDKKEGVDYVFEEASDYVYFIKDGKWFTKNKKSGKTYGMAKWPDSLKKINDKFGTDLPGGGKAAQTKKTTKSDKPEQEEANVKNIPTFIEKITSQIGADDYLLDDDQYPSYHKGNWVYISPKMKAWPDVKDKKNFKMLTKGNVSKNIRPKHVNMTELGAPSAIANIQITSSPSRVLKRDQLTSDNVKIEIVNVEEFKKEASDYKEDDTFVLANIKVYIKEYRSSIRLKIITPYKVKKQNMLGV